MVESEFLGERENEERGTKQDKVNRKLQAFCILAWNLWSVNYEGMKMETETGAVPSRVLYSYA